VGSTIFEEIVDAMEALFGKHPGFRRAHAKGIVCEGSFTPAPAARTLSRAPHLQGPVVPVVVRFSNGTGVPELPDNDPQSNPRGMAIRFQQTPETGADIVAHSFNGFPVATAEDFRDLFRALGASGPGVPQPTPLAKFLSTHPLAARFVQAPKPAPESFATTSYFAVNAFRFTNREGKSQYGRYQIHPLAGQKHLSDSEAGARPATYLFDELPVRLKAGAVQFRIVVQLAGEGDRVAVANETWPDSRPQIELGTVSLTRIAADSDAAQRRLIFDPTHLADGIEASEDPLIQVRSQVYSVSYARRNA
jgi:catalase